MGEVATMVLGLIAAIVVIAVLLSLRKLIGFIVDTALILVAALLLLLAVFAGPLGLYEDDDAERLHRKLGIENNGP
ncbi:MAG: hypothetical protein ACOCXA_03060 [Planctomycetota bacterium]